MSYAAEFVDFQAVAIREGHYESAIPDAWTDFGTYDGPMINFHKERKVTHPHRYKTFVPAADNVEHAAFFSVEKQNEYARTNGVEATVELLKTQGLKLGQVKPAPKVEITGENNPYSDSFRGTPEQREARISSLIRSNATLATSLAKSAGKTITNQKLQKVGPGR